MVGTAHFVYALKPGRKPRFCFLRRKKIFPDYETIPFPDALLIVSALERRSQ